LHKNIISLAGNLLEKMDPFTTSPSSAI
jgi:hypothetical protein